MPPELLISIRNAAEAAVAIACGVDVVDIKEPARGALGRADDATVAAIMRVVESHSQVCRPPVTMALGELRDLNCDNIAIPGGISAVKVGLAGCGTRLGWRDDWAALKSQCDGTHDALHWVAVVYADRQLARSPSVHDIIEAGTKLGCRGVLIDTYAKSAGRLWDFVDEQTLREWVERIHGLDLFAAVAGSLRSDDLQGLRDVAVDIVAVRGGVCSAGRQSSVDSRRMIEFRNAMSSTWPNHCSDDQKLLGDVPAILSLERHRLVTARGRQ